MRCVRSWRVGSAKDRIDDDGAAKRDQPGRGGERNAADHRDMSFVALIERLAGHTGDRRRLLEAIDGDADAHDRERDAERATDDARPHLATRARRSDGCTDGPNDGGEWPERDDAADGDDDADDDHE